MVKQRMDLLELLRKRGMDGDVDLLREALRVLVDGIMDAEVSAQIGAQHGERSPERVTYRNGYRNRTWDTRVGTMELHIPKLREGSYFPSLLEPRRRSEKALLAVIQQAYVEGVSTRRVDDLIKALGCDGISSSQVSRICEQLDEVEGSFLGRPLDGGPYPYVWLDGLMQKVREGGHIVNVCVVVATGVNTDGQREILGMDVGTSEDGAFWLAFPRSLTARGLSGRASRAIGQPVPHPLAKHIGRRHRGEIGIDEVALRWPVARHRPGQRHPLHPPALRNPTNSGMEQIASRMTLP